MPKNDWFIPEQVLLYWVIKEGGDQHDQPQWRYAKYSTRLDKGDYESRVHRWSKKSAEVYNNPFPVKTVNFIDWDSPEFAVTPDDDRWIMPSNFESRRQRMVPTTTARETNWNRHVSLCARCQGRIRIEEALISGIALRNQLLPSDSEEKALFNLWSRRRRASHLDVQRNGKPHWFTNHMAHQVGSAIWVHVGFVARRFPVAFWAVVLAGEEPIDHTQRRLLEMGRNGTPVHPMLEKVMQVHVVWFLSQQQPIEYAVSQF